MNDKIKEKQMRIKQIFANRRISFNTYNYPITNFLHHFKDNRIYIPEYQRGLVWNQDQKELLIESIMIDMPIGNIFLNDRGNFEYEVVDGQQRLTTIWDFYNNKFTWHGLLFKDLPKEFQAKFEMSSTIATYITYYKDRKQIIELYFRVNWAGVEHSVEEMLAIDKERDHICVCGHVKSLHGEDSFGNEVCDGYENKEFCKCTGYKNKGDQGVVD